MNGGGFGGGLDLGSLTPEQREYLLKLLPNLTGQEEEAQHQQALANALRRPEQNKRMDWGSQTARGLNQISGTLSALEAQKTRAGLGTQYQTVAQKLAELGRRKRPDEIAETPYSYGDIWGQS